MITTNPGDIFPDTALVRTFMDAVVHLNDGFVKAEEAIFKQHFIILVEDEQIAPFVLPSITYEALADGAGSAELENLK